MFRIARAAIFVFALLAAFAVPTAATDSASASYRNSRSSLDGGGARKTSTAYRSDASIAAVSVSTGSSTLYHNRDGFMGVAYQPARVTDLWASSHTVVGQIALQWTAPGNDGDENSTAGRYVIKYSTTPSESPALSNAKFEAATSVASPPAPGPRGTRQTMTVGGLLSGVTYYFAVKTAERDGVLSVQSAVAAAQTIGPLGCVTTNNVRKAGGSGFYGDIQSALDALPKAMSAASCVVIRDTETYSQQVTVRGFTNNGFQLNILSDPSFVSSAPVVNPPVSSTAGFFVQNSSVTILNIAVISTTSVSYGVYASSNYVTMSSVNVNSAGSIYAAGMRISSWTTVSYSSITVFTTNGMEVDGTLNDVSYSNIVTSGPAHAALYLSGASSNTFTVILASNPAGEGAYLELNSNYNTLRFSTFSVSEIDHAAIYLYNGPSSNTIFGNAIVNSRGGHGLVIQTASNYNRIIQNRMSGNHISGPPLFIESSSWNMVTQSFMSNPAGHGAVFWLGSNYNSVSNSTVTCNLSGSIAFYFNNSSSNTITDSYGQDTPGYGAYFTNASRYNTIAASTLAVNSASINSQALFLSGSSSNRFIGSVMTNPSGYAAYMTASSNFNTIAQSTISSAGSGFAALWLRSSSSNTIVDSYIQGSTAAFISNSTGTVIGGTVFVATNTTGTALWLSSGNVNLALTSSTFRGGQTGAGIIIDISNSGFITFTSNTITGGNNGVSIATMTCGACVGNISITSMTFSGGLTAGATAINFLGGTFTSTFTTVGFNDANIAVNVNGSFLDTASTITMVGYSGAKSGPAYENDVNSVVDWVTTLPAGCIAGTNVSKLGGWDFLAIQPAIDYLRQSMPSLSGDTCVVIRDTQTYSEAVQVRGFTNNGFQFKIMSDPSFVSSAPVVNPPSFSTAGFFVQNSSVTILNVSVISTNSVSYGVYASSNYVTLSSVNVDAGGNITQAGVFITSYSSISNSSVTVSDANAFYLAGGQNLVVQSTGSAACVNSAAYASNGNSNTLTRSYIFNSAGNGLSLASNSNLNVISLSKLEALYAAGRYALYMNGPSSTLVTQSTITSPNGNAVIMFGNASNNTISLSTITANLSGGSGVYMGWATSNTITQTSITNLPGEAVHLDVGTASTTISSSLIASKSGWAALKVLGTSNTVTGSYISNPSGYGAHFNSGAHFNTIAWSTVTSAASALPAVWISESSSNTIMSSYVQGSTAVYVSGSTSTIIGDSVLIATSTIGNAVYLSSGSVNLSLTSSTLRGGVSASAVRLEAGNSGSLSLSSNTILGGSYGVFIATQAPGAFSLSMTSMTFSGGLTAGATAIHFTGGTFTSTFTSVAFNDANIAVNVNGSFLDTASTITMVGYSGAKSGPAYENDVNSVVDWVTSLPAGCAAGANVSQLGGWDFLAIQPAIDYLRASAPSLSGDTCVIIRDTQTYSEAVQVRGFTNNGFQFKIMSDPSFVSSAPVVNPPSFSTAGFYVQNSSVTILNVSVISTNSVSYGVYASSDYVTISSVNVDAGGNITQAGMRISSWTAVSYSSVTVFGAHGLRVDGILNTVSYTNAVTSGTAIYGLFLNAASSNNFTVILASNPAGNGAYLSGNANYNTVSQSTMTSDTGGGYSALYITGSSSNSIIGSSITNPKGYAALIGGTYNRVSSSTIRSDMASNSGALIFNASVGGSVLNSFINNPFGSPVNMTNGSRLNTVDLSTITSGSAQYFALNIAGSGTSSNTISNSYVANSAGHGLLINLNANYNTITQSTMIAIGSFFSAYEVRGSSFNTVNASYMRSPSGYAARINSGGAYNAINQSTMTSATSSYPAVLIGNTSSNTISQSYVQGSTAVWISNSTGTIIDRSVLVATNTMGIALVLSSGSVNLTLSSSVLRGGASAAAVRLEDGNSGELVISSNTILGGSYGLSIATQAPGIFSLSVTSLTFAGGLTAGATAIHFTGGTFTSTFTTVGFNDANIAVNVNGSFLDTASTITMVGYSGAKSGPAYENDVNSVVDWVTTLPAGCVAGTNVSKLGGWDFLAIQPAIDYLRASAPSLSGDTCVIIRDTQTYSEAVQVRGFTNNGFQFKIMSDPSFVSSAPVVNPPSFSTAGFFVQNDSVTIQNVSVISTNSVSYGVYASSGYVTISSVNVDAGGNITQAGMRISSWTAVSYSIVTVFGAHGIQVDGTLNNVSYTNAQTSSTVKAALFLNAASTNTFTVILASNPAGHGAYLNSNANYNTITLSTMASNSATFSGLLINNSDWNNVIGSYVTNPLGHGFGLTSSADYNAVSQSTISVNASSPFALSIINADFNTVTGCLILNPLGIAARIATGADFNVISMSTITSNSTVWPSLLVTVSSSNAFLNSYIQGSEAVHVNGSTGTVFGGTVFVATNTVGDALQMDGGSVNLTVTTSTLKAGPLGAGMYLFANNSGLIALTSNTVVGGSKGLSITTMACGACDGNISITSMTFAGGLTAGATAIHFTGGTFTSTFTTVGFNDANIAVNVNGSFLDTASTITMSGYSGAKSGPAYENDVNSVVDWVTTLPAGCIAGTNVSKLGGWDFLAIQPAIDYLRLNPSLNGDTCVVIRDTQTYSESVQVRGFTNNGFQFKIMSDPSFVSSAPVVNPPSFSTAGFFVQNDSVTIQNVSVISTNSVSYGVYASSNYVTLSSVNVDAGGNITQAGMRISSWTAISYSSVTVFGAHGLRVDGILNNVSYTNAVTSGTAIYAFFLNAASSNTFSVILASNPAGTAAYITGSSYNTISQSTMVSNGGTSALSITSNASWNHVIGSLISNTSGAGLSVSGNAQNNTITLSTMSMNSPNYYALSVNNSSSNSVVGSYLVNYGGHGAGFVSGAAYNTISQSTMVSAGTGYAGFLISGASSNSVQGCLITGQLGSGMFIQFAANYNNVRLSTITSLGSSAGYDGLYIRQASSNTIVDSYIQGPTAVYLDGSSSTVIGGSVMIATNTVRPGLWMTANSMNLSVTSSTLGGGVNSAGLLMDPDNLGSITLTSNTITGGRWGLSIATMTCGACVGNISIASMTFAGGLTAGATAIHFAGGTFTSTFTTVAFNDVNIAVNVNGSFLDTASTITMVGYSGVKSGPAYENDVNSVVDWATTLPAGCAAGTNVSKLGGWDFLAIQPAIDYLKQSMPSLSGDTCVVIRDTQTYSEAVQVRGFTNNGFQFKIMSDPSFVSSAPVVNPPALSTAGFLVQNSSVTILNVSVISTNSVSYGVYASSNYVTISSVNVDAGGNITQAGIRISSWTAVSYSSVTVFGAHGIRVDGNVNSVSYTNAVTSGTAIYALFVNAASSNTFTVILASNPAGIGAYLASYSNYNSIIQSTFASSNAGYNALNLSVVSSNTIVGSYITNPAGDGFTCNGGNYNTISQSTSTAANGNAFVLSNSSWNTVIGSMFVGKTGANLNTTASFNTISLSTMTGNSNTGYGFNINNGSSNSIVGSYIGNSNGVGFVLSAGANNNSISQSTIISAGANSNVLNIAGGSSNTIYGCYLANSDANGFGAQIQNNSYYNTINQSTVSVNAPNRGAYYLQNGASSNTVIGSMLSNPSGYAARIFTNSNYNTITLSTMINNTALYQAVWIQDSSSNTISSSYVQGSTAVWISGSTGTVIDASVLLATNTLGHALMLSSGSVGLIVTGSTLKGGVSGPAIQLDWGNAGVLTLSSNTILGGSYGVFIATQAPGAFSLSMTSMTFSGGLTAGATAIHFTGGTFTSTFTSVAFNDANIAVNVNGSYLDTASTITMVGYSGAKSGPAYENDVNSVVDWVTTLPAGCVAGTNVSKLGGWDFLAIQPAIDYLRASAPSLSGDTCVIIRDTQTYSEAVQVRGFANNGFQFKIMSDPSFVSSAPVVNPPSFSTAGFFVQNSSVTILNVSVISTNSVSYGVYASSSYVTISSVNVDAGGNIYTAGMRISSWTAVSYSSVTVGDAHGYLLSGSTMTTISYSSATNNSSGSNGFYIAGGKNNAFTVIFASNSHLSGNGFLTLQSDTNTLTQSYLWGGSHGVYLNNFSHYNTISLSTMIGKTFEGLFTFLSDSNTVTQSYMFSNSGWGSALGTGSDYNTISLSTMIGNGISGFYAYGSDSNTVTQSYMSGSKYGAWLDPGSDFNTISFSTVISANVATPALYMLQGSSNTVANSYVQGSTAAFVSGSTGTVIFATVFVATNTAGSALVISSSNVNLTLGASTLKGGVSGAGIFMDSANSGFIAMASNTITGGRWGLSITTMTCGACVGNISITSMTFAGGLTAGATAINFVGGTFTSTFTTVSFADANIAVNVNGSFLDTASTITMVGYSGVRSGPAYENDVNSVVDWVTTLPAGCAVGTNVSKLGGWDFLAIQPAIDYLKLTPNLSGDTCVVIRDTQTYSEAVQVRGFTNNGFQFKIMSDPSFVSSAPVVNPPAFSTAGFFVQNSSVTILNVSVISTNSVSYGVYASSNYVTMSSVNVDAGGNITQAGIRVSSWSAVSYSSVTVGNAYGFWLNGSTMTTVGFSTAVNNSAGMHAVYLNGGGNNSFNVLFASNSHLNGSAFYVLDSDTNSVTGSYLWGGRYGAVLYVGSSYNWIALSTMIGGTNDGLNLGGATSNTVTRSFMQGGLRGAVFTQGTRFNVISVSTMIGGGWHGFAATGADFNSITQSYMQADLYGAFFNVGADSNLISQSTIAARLNHGLYVEAASSNTVTGSIIVGAQYGIWISSDANYNTISWSTATSNAAAFAALYMQGSSNTIMSSYIQGSTAVYVSGSTGAVIGDSVLIATSTIGNAVYLSSGSVNLSLSSSTLRGGVSASAVRLEAGNSGSLSLSSNTIVGGTYGLFIATQAPGAFNLTITSLTFSGGMTPGATAIHFAGGTFISTFTTVQFTDTNIAINVNGSFLDTASTITMVGYSGVRSGPAYEYDVNSVVDWVTTLPAGCVAGTNVSKLGGWDFLAIQPAIDYLKLSPILSGDTCVVIRDTQTYSEAVQVRGFTNNGFQFKIISDPSFVSSAPVVNPPSFSTAGFFVQNTSVTILNVSVLGVNSVPYGVYASSGYVTISSVNVNSDAGIYFAGVAISSYSSVGHSSITVQGAHGLYSDGTLNAVSYSTAQANASGFNALYLNGASSNTFTVFLASNPAGIGVYFRSANSNTLILSTVSISNGTGNDSAVFFNASSSNTITQSYIWNSINDAIQISNPSSYNSVLQSTIVIAGGSGAGIAFFSGGNSYNRFSQLLITESKPDGSHFGIVMDPTNNVSGNNYNTFDRIVVAISGTNAGFMIDDSSSSYNTLSASTITVIGGGPGLLMRGLFSNTIVNSYVQGETAVIVANSTGATIGGSSLIATGPTGHAFWAASGNVNLILASSTFQGGSSGAGIFVSSGNSGFVALTSNTITGGRWGVSIATMTCGACEGNLSITSMTFSGGLTAGATAIDFLGGTFTSTFTTVGFNDANISINVNASFLDTASTITMRADGGAKTGPDYENDPNQIVDWGDLLPPDSPFIYAVDLTSITVQYGLVGASGYVVQASTMANFSGVLYTSSTLAQAIRLAPQTLSPNTTYYLRTGALWGTTTIYAQTILSTATLSKPVTGTDVYQINVTSMIVNWLPLALAPPDASSNSAAGYVLHVSTRSDFLPLWTSSQTPNVALSTLTVDGLRGEVTYYFRVGSINSAGAVNYAATISTMMPMQLRVEMSTRTISLPAPTDMNTVIVVTTSTVLTNIGNVKETYYIRVTTVTPGSPWYPGTTPGVDRFVVWTVINPTEPLPGDFNDAEDKIGDAETPCGSLVIAMGGGTCVQVPVGEQRTLWTKIATPVVTSTGVAQEIRIYARAVRDPDPDPNP
jgi:sulfur carrier protein ThiS